jgi:hypothetical protein
MEKNDRNSEGNKIKYTLQQNKYQINKSLKRKLNKGSTTNQHCIKENKKQNKWTTFTHFGHETKKLPTYFKIPTSN